MTIRLRLWMVPLVGVLLGAPVDAGAFDLFRSEEATIADIEAAFKAKTLTCRVLVQTYLDRIERAWSEPTLIKIVYGYEQATRHRRPPASTPPLPARP